MSLNLLSQPNNNNDENFIFVAYINSTRNLSQLLKAINFREIATVIATTDGLKITVEDSKSVQGNAFVQAALFQEYSLKEDNVVFKVHLNVLLECLNIFGTNCNTATTTTLKMCYAGYGTPLVLLLEENGVLTDCKLQTMEPDDILDFELSPSKIVNKIIMKSDVLKEAWLDLDMNSESLELLMSPNEPYFQLTTKGTLGVINVTFSKESDMMECFECTKTLKNRYHISLIKPSLKALVQSAKVSIRTDERGFLCLQYLIKAEGAHVCFVEYICAPDDYYDEDDDES